MTRLIDIRISPRLLFALGVFLLGLALAGCLSSGDNGSDRECSANHECDQTGNYCQDGTCVWNDSFDAGDTSDSVSDGRCSTHSDCDAPAFPYCQDGMCVSDLPGWGEDGDSWDDSDASDTADSSDTSDTVDADPECVFDTDCSPGFRCNEDFECVRQTDAGDASAEDAQGDSGPADAVADLVGGDASCDEGERLNPLTGECVSIDGG